MTIKTDTLAVSNDLRKLYDKYRDKQIPREEAETLANIAGKILRAQAILMVEDERNKGLNTIASSD